MDRRAFLTGGLCLGFSLWGCTGGDPAAPPAPPPAADLPERTPPADPPGADVNAWVRIGPDDTVRLFVPESEMGQGVLTAVATILADELHIGLERVQVLHAPLNPEAFGRQSTGGSTSIRRGYDGVRKAGAAAREMLVAAAAASFGVDPATCRTEDGAVVDDQGHRATYGAVAEAAARLPVPDAPALRATPALVGTPVPRVDLPSKVDGSAVYGIDVQLPGMLVASVARCPIFGGAVAGFDATAARAVPGVVDVVEIPTGIAVVARHTWAALRGREALQVQWNDGGHGGLSSERIAELARAALPNGLEARREGDAEAALGAAARTVEAVYEAPYLAHAPMEPLNCTASVSADRCEIWVPTQSPSGTAAVAEEITGLPPAAIAVHTTMLGGGFGRRSQTDFVADAVHLAKRLGKPVEVCWTRADDLQAGWYRPMAHNVLRGGVGADGMPVAWSHRIASPSILRPMGRLEGVDAPAVEGAANLPYAVPAIRVTWADVDVPIPVWWWRSVGSSQNAWVTECFLDELCALGGRDPLEVRRALLRAAGATRHLGALELAAERAGWGTPLPEGRARGLAVHESFGSFVAQVAEVSIEGGEPRVHRVVCAVDCGRVVNPDTIAAQIESSVAYGVSAALYGEIVVKDGRAVPSNFHDYPVLRIDRMPAVETHIVPSTAAHGGIGEPGLPPVAPAVCNALLALTKRPVRRLPIRLPA